MLLSFPYSGLRSFSNHSNSGLRSFANHANNSGVRSFSNHANSGLRSFANNENSGSQLILVSGERYLPASRSLLRTKRSSHPQLQNAEGSTQVLLQASD